MCKRVRNLTAKSTKHAKKTEKTKAEIARMNSKLRSLDANFCSVFLGELGGFKS
jgi:hypothetical protein